MFWEIAKKDILENLLSYKFYVGTLLGFLLIVSSILIMHGDYSDRLQKYSSSTTDFSKNRAIKKPDVLSIFVKGLDERMSRPFDIEFGGRIEVSSTQQQAVNNIFKLLITPDLLFIVKIFLSLMAIFLAFDTICGEKEHGTLSLMLSNSVSRNDIFFGKWLGGAISLFIPFLIGVVISLLIVSFTENFTLNIEEYIRLFLFVLISIFFLLFFFSLSILISGRTHRTSTSIVVLIFLWSIFVFIIPNMGYLLAEPFSPLPSLSLLEQKRSQIWVEEIFKRIHNRREISLDRAFSQINERNDKLEEDYRGKFNRRAAFTKSLSRLSPVSSYMLSAAIIMRTGIEDERRLKDQILWFKDKIFEKKELDFSYQAPTLSQSLNIDTLFDILLLILYNSIVFALGYVAFLKYDVRWA